MGSLAHTEPPEGIIHLSLAQVLPKGMVLAIHRTRGFVALLSCDEQHPQMQAAQCFSASEMLLLLPVMLSYPHFCHYETLLASFAGGTTEVDVEQAHRLLSRAKERGEWELLMRPVRNMLSSARLKLHPLGMTVLSLFETGYVLQAHIDGSLRRKRVRASHQKGVIPMNQEEREALTQQATAHILACLHQPGSVEEETIRSMLKRYGIEMFIAGGRTAEEWISRTLTGLPIPMLITRTLPEGEGAQEPVLAYHWQTRDREGDAVTFAYALEQALLSVLRQQEQQP